MHHKQHITPHNVFLSTLSLRRATLSAISSLTAYQYFYPRSPCGERPLTTCKYACKPEFLSTLSLRRATSPHRPAPASVRISIHALLAESDRVSQRDKLHNGNFYPRSPCGERRNGYLQTRRPCAISIHALLAESDPSA